MKLRSSISHVSAIVVSANYHNRQYLQMLVTLTSTAFWAAVVNMRFLLAALPAAQTCGALQR
jgi:hypothetical protein